MGQEIEHKFRVDVSRWRPQGEGVAIRQGYLSAEKDRVVRIRTAGPKAYLTVKGPGHISRAEFEYEIPFEDAAAMLNDLCLPGAIEKTRYKARRWRPCLGDRRLSWRQRGPRCGRDRAWQRR
ncbi:MAG: CYTH domain-containing protein [Methylovirgula sp.]